MSPDTPRPDTSRSLNGVLVRGTCNVDVSEDPRLHHTARSHRQEGPGNGMASPTSTYQRSPTRRSTAIPSPVPAQEARKPGSSRQRSRYAQPDEAGDSFAATAIASIAQPQAGKRSLTSQPVAAGCGGGRVIAFTRLQQRAVASDGIESSSGPRAFREHGTDRPMDEPRAQAHTYSGDCRPSPGWVPAPTG